MTNIKPDDFIYGHEPDYIEIYGVFDDLILIEGGEYPDVYYCWGKKLRFYLTDGTIADISYGKGDLGIWEIEVKKEGSLFNHIERCDNENAVPCSDVLRLRKHYQKIVRRVKEFELIEGE